MKRHRKSLLVLMYVAALAVVMLIAGMIRWLRRKDRSGPDDDCPSDDTSPRPSAPLDKIRACAARVIAAERDRAARERRRQRFWDEQIHYRVGA
jgi:hypothetical protein